jgi:hypothetical protein
MFWSGRFVGAIVFGIAISLCLTVCSMPEMFAPQKAAAGHCHEEQENEQQKDSQMRCCNRELILPSSYTGIIPETDQTMLPQENFSPKSNAAFDCRLASDRFLEASGPPLIATILRI